MAEIGIREFELCRQQAQEKFQDLKETSRYQGEEISDIKELLIQVTESVRLQSEINAKFDRRIEALENKRQSDTSPKFWQTKWFDYIVRGVIFLASLITAAAVAKDTLVEVLVNAMMKGG